MSTQLQIIEQPKAQKIISLETLWKMHVQLKGALSAKTLYSLEQIGRLFCQFCDGKELNGTTITAWSMYVRQGRKASWVEVINTRIKTFLRWIKKLNYLNEDLADLVITPPADQRNEIKIWTEAEYETIKAYLKEKPTWQTHLWLMILGYRTGMRLIDCSHLRWGQINLSDNAPSYIEFAPIKTARLGQRCMIPIMPFSDVHEWLLKLKAARHLHYKRQDGIEDYVHQDAPGLYMCTFARVQRDFNNIFNRSLGKANVNGRTFKHFRSTFISNLVNAGANYALVCRMTGHTKLKTFLLYLKQDPKALQAELAKSFEYASQQTKLASLYRPDPGASAAGTAYSPA